MQDGKDNPQDFSKMVIREPPSVIMVFTWITICESIWIYEESAIIYTAFESPTVPTKVEGLHASFSRGRHRVMNATLGVSGVVPSSRLERHLVANILLV